MASMMNHDHYVNEMSPPPPLPSLANFSQFSNLPAKTVSSNNLLHASANRRSSTTSVDDEENFQSCESAGSVLPPNCDNSGFTQPGGVDHEFGYKQQQQQFADSYNFHPRDSAVDDEKEVASLCDRSSRSNSQKLATSFSSSTSLSRG